MGSNWTVWTVDPQKDVPNNFNPSKTSSLLLILVGFLGDHPIYSIGLVVVALLLIHLFRAITTRFFHLASWKGPWIAAYTRLWLCITLASGKSAQIFVDVNQKYGPLARIGPNNLVTDDPEFVRSILAARSRYTRGPWFDSIKIDPHVPNIVSERRPGKHNRLRYQMSAGYQGKDVTGLEDIVNERITDFMDRIDQRWVSSDGSTKVFDIARRIQYLTVDIITHLSFGDPLGMMETDSDRHRFLETIESQLPIVQHFSVILEFNDWLSRAAHIPFIRKLIIPSSTDKTGIGMIMGLSRKVIDKRFGPGAITKKDILGSFISRGLDASEVEMEISISLVAGSDTTATAMRSTLLSIISNPRVYSRLIREIDEAVARGEVSAPISNEEAQKLPYLQAVIKEGLRRFPPITQLRERMVPPGGDYFNGQFIPGGTFIGFDAWGLQLNRVFGDDPEIFRPERWLIQDQEQLSRMNQVQELVFGYGTTKCLGIPIAMMNLNKIFVELLRRFDISVINPQQPWTSICYGIFFQKNFKIRITRRKVL